ncbi:hypothetical protein FHT02_003782 [Sphingomonas xinjiangensis]|uniref:Uncharacterized protein n=1 Tax=Sphingomonas xinjiangensis TaxID=643568 RepID=A0A840YS76_9SPHN|nr:hypothetical protein [Sphingomonas xinjiangensis]
MFISRIRIRIAKPNKDATGTHQVLVAFPSMIAMSLITASECRRCALKMAYFHI